jgi:hypothetical protein
VKLCGKLKNTGHMEMPRILGLHITSCKKTAIPEYMPLWSHVFYQIVSDNPNSINYILMWTFMFLPFLCCIYVQCFRFEVVFLSLLCITLTLIFTRNKPQHKKHESNNCIPNIPCECRSRGVSRVWRAGHVPWAPLAGGFWLVWVSTF